MGTELSLDRILPHCFDGFPSKGKLANPSTRCSPSLAKRLTLLARPVQIERYVAGTLRSVRHGD